MHPAALGLTCQAAFRVFSENETLALQNTVAELQALLRLHRPPHTRDAICPRSLVRIVRDMFDSIHPPHARSAPVSSQGSAADPLRQTAGCIWNDLGGECPSTPSSLRTVLARALQDVLGDGSAAYCTRQSHKAMKAARHALLGAYMASGWRDFFVQQRQEFIVWQALMDHFGEMQVDLSGFQSH
jgi:hypothetical protein